MHVDGVFLTAEESSYCWVVADRLPPFDMECHVTSLVGSTVSGALALNDLIM